ncbi:MAG: alpha/beta fold hydrolase [Phycisphaerales bacterium]
MMEAGGRVIGPGRSRLAASGAAVMLIVVALLAGCTSPYSRLRDEDANQRLAALKSRCPKPETTLVPTAGPPAARVAVHRVRGSAGAPVVVFIHGAMSDRETWRFIAGALSTSCELWLVDLPGCGGSDCPDPARFGEGVYSPDALAARVRQAIAEVASESGASRVTLVGHSLGASIALRMAIEGGTPEIERLVLISPLDVAVGPPNAVIRELATASALKLSLAQTTGVLRDRFSAATLESVDDSSLALRQECDKRLSFFDSSRHTRALQATLRQAVPWDRDHPDWDRIDEIVAGYGRVSVPSLIITGRRDTVLPPSMGYKLAAELRGSTLVPLPRVMHSPQLEAPEESSRLIAEFVRESRVTSEYAVRFRQAE